jgi:hypothetical protein
MLPIIKPSFTFGFSSADMVPILQMQHLMVQDSVLHNFQQQSLLGESILRRQRDMNQASLQAQAIMESAPRESAGGALKEPGRREGKAGEKESVTSYAITYYNPELHKTEVLEARSEIKMADYGTKLVEEAVATQSAYAIYSFIAQPLIKTEVVPWKLQEILSQREYGTPPPPPSGAAVVPARIVAQRESDTAELARREEAIREAAGRFVMRKEQAEAKVDEEIVLLEEAVAMIRAGEDMDRVIEKLPPLSRARYLLALRKKHLGRQAVISLLLKDSGFLKMVKKKLEMFTLDDLMSIYKALRGMRRKG